MKKIFVRCAVVLILIMFSGCFSAFAQEQGEPLILTAPENIVSGQSTSAIKLSWERVENATGYRIYYKSGDIWKKALKSTENTTHTFKGLNPASKFTFAVRAYNLTEGVVTWADAYTVINTATKPEKVTFNIKSTASSLTLNWSKVSCDGYSVYYKYPSAEKWKTATGETTFNAQNYEKLPSGRVYQFAVRAFVNTDEGKRYGEYEILETATEPSAAKNITCSATDKAVTLKWEKVSNVTHYKIYRKVSGGWKSLGYVTKNSKTVEGLKPGTKYTFAVRSYIKTKDAVISGSYRQVSTITTPATPVFSLSATDSSVKIFWNKTEGATGYRLYCRKSEKDSWKAITTLVGKTSYVYKNLPEKTTYFIAVKAYLQNGDTRVWGKYNSLSIKTRAWSDGKTVVSFNEDNWNLALVDTFHQMPKNYEPKLSKVTNSSHQLDYRVTPYFNKMYAAALNEGVELIPNSGYRTYSEQKAVYEDYVADYMYYYDLTRIQAEKTAAKNALPPGCSEHNLGLAMDIATYEGYFEISSQYTWLKKHAYEYGFIERYPKGKEEITGVVYEPWHWRYVGVKAATAMKQSGMCFEEYLFAN